MSELAANKALITDASGYPLSGVSVPYGSDASLGVEFYMNGDDEYIRIIVPGGKTEIDRKTHEGDRMRFGAQYAMFLRGEMGPVGMLLSDCPEFTAGEVETLVGRKIRTVEQLANLTDGAFQFLPPGTRAQSVRAAAVIDGRAAATAAVDRQEIDDLKRQVADLMALLRDKK